MTGKVEYIYPFHIFWIYDFSLHHHFTFLTKGLEQPPSNIWQLGVCIEMDLVSDYQR